MHFRSWPSGLELGHSPGPNEISRFVACLEQQNQTNLTKNTAQATREDLIATRDQQDANQSQDLDGERGLLSSNLLHEPNLIRNRDRGGSGRERPCKMSWSTKVFGLSLTVMT